nr:ABC transporter ATP-binding protein [Ruania zhangjianzhongii]
MTAQPLLSVRDLSVEFHTRDGVVPAVQGIELDVHAGRTLAVLGESGSGKSVTAQAIMGLLDTPPAQITGGTVVFDGTDLLTVDAEHRRKVNGESLAMVFQDALSALNPVYTVGSQLAELLRVRRGMRRKAAWEQAIELMDRVRIPAPRERAKDYPHQFSGGMRQRIMIAMAIALDPQVLIADEPTTALDVTVQAQIMELLLQLQQDSGMGLILITHDLGVVAEVADEICAMYAGRRVEAATVPEVFAAPAHPYTRGLLQSMPRPESRSDDLWAIPGAPPNLLRLASGCAFQPRCDAAIDKCATNRPEMLTVDDGPRLSACHRREEVFHGVA